jgi:hypothetical protein
MPQGTEDSKIPSQYTSSLTKDFNNEYETGVLTIQE